MKLHGIKRLIVIMITCMIGGGVVGAIVGASISANDFAPLLVTAKDAFVQWFIPVSIFLCIATYLVSITNEKKVNHCLSSLSTAADEEADLLEDSAGKYSARIVLWNGILQCISILCIGELLDYYLIRQVSDNTTIFLCEILLAALLSFLGIFFTIRHYNIVKKFYNKEGDPGDKDWAEKYFNSLDEAEQMEVYRAYKETTETSYKVIIGLMCITLLMNALFHTGTFATFVLAVVYCSMQYTYQRSVRRKRRAQ